MRRSNKSSEKKRDAQLPVPWWLLTVPLVLVVLALVALKNGQPEVLWMGLYLLGALIFAYLYLRMIRVWRQRQARRKP